MTVPKNINLAHTDKIKDLTTLSQWVFRKNLFVINSLIHYKEGILFWSSSYDQTLTTNIIRRNLNLYYYISPIKITTEWWTYFPVRPSQSLTDLSKEALAMRRVSGEKHTWLMSCWWPVMRARGLVALSGFHRNSVESSDPDTIISGCEPCQETENKTYLVDGCLNTWIMCKI